MKRLYFSLLFLSLNCIVFANSFFVKATIDSTLLLIGEQAKLSFEITQPQTMTVKMPVFSNTIVNGLEIVERLQDTVKLDGSDKIQINQSYVITSFDSALYYIPPFDFVADDTVKSNALSIKVLSVPVDTTQHAVTDIKPVYKPPFDWMLLLRVVFCVLLAALLGVLIYFLVKKLKHKNKPEEEGNKEPARPAHEVAIEQLTTLKKKKLWQQDKIKEYHTQLVDILRTYIENRFNINATEQTSGELLNELRPLFAQDASSYDILKRILSLADLVKFAKWNPFPEENDKSMTDAFVFVEATKEPEVSAEKEKELDNTPKEESAKEQTEK